VRAWLELGQGMNASFVAQLVASELSKAHACNFN